MVNYISYEMHFPLNKKVMNLHSNKKSLLLWDLIFNIYFEIFIKIDTKSFLESKTLHLLKKVMLNFILIK